MVCVSHSPRVTVVTITTRNLYLKHQVEGLAKQSFTDFDWIIIADDVDEIQAVVQSAPFPVHVFPPLRPSPYKAPSHALNSGVAYSRGELLYLMLDYVIPMPNSIERHWYIHEHQPHTFVTGACYYINTPEDAIAAYQEEERIRTIKTGGHEWISTELFRAKRAGVRNWYTGRNDSCPTEAWLSCNGMEESLDGDRRDQDAEMSERLMNSGLMYIVDTVPSAKVLPHPPIPKETKGIDFNYSNYIDMVSNSGKTISRNSYNLREEREKCLLKLV